MLFDLPAGRSHRSCTANPSRKPSADAYLLQPFCPVAETQSSWVPVQRLSRQTWKPAAPFSATASDRLKGPVSPLGPATWLHFTVAVVVWHR
jgi:hypothetical protein